LNTKVFKHKGIGWEWSLAFGSMVVVVIGVEAWKLAKRYTGWFTDGEGYGDDTATDFRAHWPSHELGLRQGFFGFAKTLTKANLRSFGSDPESSKSSSNGKSTVFST